MEILKWILIGLLLGGGFLSTIIPILPGLVLILIGILLYVLFFGLAKIGVVWLVTYIIIVVASFLIGYITSIIGVKCAKASKYGVFGSMLGGMLGLILGNLPGMIIGTFLGAFLTEYFLGKDMAGALRAGTGAFLGFLAGGVINIILALIILISFLVLIFR